MPNIAGIVQKEIEKFWPKAQQGLSKISKDVSKILEKSEKDFAHLSKNVHKGVNRVVSQVKREELYYELGKNILPLLSSEQLKDKNIFRIYSEIQRLNKAIRSKKA